jgi:hypothetical protein
MDVDNALSPTLRSLAAAVTPSPLKSVSSTRHPSSEKRFAIALPNPDAAPTEQSVADQISHRNLHWRLLPHR